eukprot:g3621.t1
MYGRFEANCSLPSREASGIWPAFWLMPQNGQCWPTGGEIDIFEMNGNWVEDYIYASYHWGEPGECGKDKEPIPGKGYKPANAQSRNWQTDFHVYAVEWREDRIDFYLDNELYFTKTKDQVRLPTKPMFIIFDVAVDGWLFKPGKNPATYENVHMLVDYVRVYKEV